MKKNKKNKQKESLTTQFFKDFLVMQNNQVVSNTEDTVMVNCDNKECKKLMICPQEFKSEVYTCPHCGKNQKVRSYKNGKVTSTLVK